MKKIQANEIPTVGNGKLTEYKGKKDSWIMKQMKDGKPGDGIKIDKSDDEHWRFASKCRKVASKIVCASETFVVDKKAKQLSSTSNTNFRFHLKWSLSGEFDGVSLNELSIVKEMLFARVNSDIENLNYLFTTQMEKIGEVCIDFASSCLFCEAVIGIEVNIVTNVSNIIEQIRKFGFDTGDAV